MTKQNSIACAAALGLMALTAVVLGRAHAFQRIGRPGVRVVSGAVYGEKGQVLAPFQSNPASTPPCP